MGILTSHSKARKFYVVHSVATRRHELKRRERIKWSQGEVLWVSTNKGAIFVLKHFCGLHTEEAKPLDQNVPGIP